MTREEIEALAAQHGMLGQMVTTNLLVSFAELVAAEKPAANVQLLEAPELTDTEITAIEKTCWEYKAFSGDDRLYLNHVKFARAVIAADRAKRGG